MSDNIYGSSLRAAKSKANYLFEGDFRRKPSQNLSGASRSLARGELLQQAAEQRQNREDNRRKEKATATIQSFWRGYRCRKALAENMRSNFDTIIGDLRASGRDLAKLNYDEVASLTESLTREFIFYYHIKTDKHRFDNLIDFMTKIDSLEFSRVRSRDPFLFKSIKLSEITLKFLEQYFLEDNHTSGSCSRRYLNFLDKMVFSEVGWKMQWKVLNDNKVYTILRRVFDRHYLQTNESTKEYLRRHPQSSPYYPKAKTFPYSILQRPFRIVIEDSRPKEERGVSQSLVNSLMLSLYKEFLRGPLDPALEQLFFEKIVNNFDDYEVQCIYGFRPPKVLDAFRCYQISSFPTSLFSATSFDKVQSIIESTWLCLLFVKSISRLIGHIIHEKKVQADYIEIISILIAPAEYITNISLMEAASNDDIPEGNELLDRLDSSQDNRIKKNEEINSVITRLIDEINKDHHAYHLRLMLDHLNFEFPRVNAAIVRICNLMLARNQKTAIFKCRLLYTVAFSGEFIRSLWKSIISASSSTVFGSNTPIYIQITRGNNIKHESWSLFLPQLKLFCSLYSDLLPTLDDEEFYTNDDSSMFVETNDQHSFEQQQQSSKKTATNSSFFKGKELISISAVLRDICVGFIELLYQDNRYTYTRPALVSENESSKLLSFEIEMCFKALVRLMRQLHARDSRKRFCPDGHWICPSVVIPANKAIDFQLVTSQQGRLISQMTKDDANAERISTFSEIKTVLILKEIPFVISFHDRVQILHQLLRKEKLAHQSEGYHFGLPGTAIQVQIRRNYIYEDAFEKLSFENEPNMKLPFRISLINAVGANEAGIDGGGLSKEFLSELLKAGFDPMRGFFKSTKDQLLYPNPSANVLFSNLPEGYEIHYEFLGRMLGKAIFEKIMVELPLASFFLAKLLGRDHDVDLHNLASLDPVLYKNLVYLKNYKGRVSDLNLDFTISNNDLGEHETVELEKDGSKIPVTNENKIKYVHLVADYRLNKQIRTQCAAFKRGLSQLIDLDWLRMFDSRELQILISGAPTLIDISDWRRHTLYANGYSDDCEAINTFWRVADQLDESQKRKLLKFATSCSLPPLLGFKDLVPQFTIAPTEETRLPTASTCMNLLKLPECEDESTMRSKLLYAIESNSGFELS